MGWQQSFRLMAHEVLGLDIGSSQVKLVKLRKDSDGYTVTAASIADIGDGENGNPSSRQNAGPDGPNVVKTIRRCLASSRARTRMAVCGVSGPEVAVRYFKFPALPAEEITGAVLLEAAQVCPFNVETASVDYQIIPNGENSICGVLVAATNSLIKTKKQLARNASLTCVLMDVDGLALLNCFGKQSGCKQSKAPAGKATAILNVGGSYTTLAIAGDNSVPFIRDICDGGNGIIEQIAEETDMSKAAVKNVLFGEDIGASERPVGENLARACQKLIVDVTETLRYYVTQEKAAVVEKVLICGGFALAKGFVELLASRLPAPAELWNPFDSACCRAEQELADILKKRGPAMAVAAGLAMRSL